MAISETILVSHHNRVIAVFLLVSIGEPKFL